MAAIIYQLDKRSGITYAYEGKKSTNSFFVPPLNYSLKF